jgi:hypothetical protein
LSLVVVSFITQIPIKLTAPTIRWTVPMIAMCTDASPVIRDGLLANLACWAAKKIGGPSICKQMSDFQTGH